jgi:predicted thioesterase
VLEVVPNLLATPGARAHADVVALPAIDRYLDRQERGW